MLVAPRMLFAFLLLLCGSIRADDTQTVMGYGDELLQDYDLRNITLQVVSSNPELASSPGVKFYTTQRDPSGSLTAGIVFLPHANSAGVEEAFGVVCSRSVSDQPWSCTKPYIRRYFQIENQVSGLRVIDGVLPPAYIPAVVEASRDALTTHLDIGPTDKCEALTVSEPGFGPGVPDGYLVSFRCNRNGETKLIVMHATETPGGDMTRSSNWRADEYVFPKPH